MKAAFPFRRVHLCWFAISVCLCACLSAAASNPNPVRAASKNVLIINEVGTVHPAMALVTQSLLSRLSADGEFDVEWYLESLDTTSFVDAESQQKAQSWLFQKYQDRKIDVIVAVGPNPIKLVVQYANTFLPNVPVVICGISDKQAGYPELGSRFTGSWMKLEPARTLDAALQMLPKTRQVVVVGGSSTFDKKIETMVKTALSSYPAPLTFTYMTDLEMATVLGRLRHLSSGTIVLYTSFFRDVAGNQFTNATTALPLVAEASSVPVFGMSDMYLGHGIVGGYVIGFAESGRIAADMVLDVLRGKPVQDIPIRIIPGSFMFDSKQLHRWGLSESNLPVGSIVLYREPTFWQRSKSLLITSFVIVTGLLGLVIYLLFEQNQLRRARNEQMRLSGLLITAQEDERKYFASELHDDFGQRLALLSLGLETVTEVPDLPKEALGELRDLWNVADTIGADLHTLSHRLHSSTLERLGLVAGVESLCEEFSARQRVQVLFSHKDISRAVPPDVSLCLFRVVQESLRNVRKHSRASRVWVTIEDFDDVVHLSICDDGAGFELANLNGRQGLGIRSMQERARLIGARFEVRSKPREGTGVHLWTRLPQGGQETPASQVMTESPVTGV